MDASTPISADLQRQQDRKRKRKALLAGGVVLGLGAAVTLAAWSDDVFADGVFNTGNNFELVAAVDAAGTDFRTYNGPDSIDGETGRLDFDFSLDATSMEPGETVYAPITLATSDTSDMGGTVSLASVDAEGSYERLLTYRIYKDTAHGANCNATDASGLESWTNPAGGITSIVDGLTADIPLVGPLLNSVLGLLPPVSRPVMDPVPLLTGSPLPVGAGQNAPVQHLCVAVEMGLPEGPLDLFGQIDVANSQLVSALTSDVEDNSTTVTWRFAGSAG
ncbi:hypothetical protein G6016_01555 [Dietzia aerolata]|uniref:SipW-dependent-type signal peptide-containing protein n=1 Tax=Dietzia aerolata TaxID=595984 RepID=A0ABV5JNC9_9ACTN|nr:SipW-dependent-type signal peptide-containing protein [Dietzia aerolata]MBB0967665.1 hypothetical protein [Dietzia aerolata]